MRTIGNVAISVALPLEVAALSRPSFSALITADSKCTSLPNFSKIEQPPTELLTIQQFFRPIGLLGPLVLQEKWTKLYQIWAEYRPIIIASDVLLDLIYAVQFGKVTGVEI